MSLHQDFLKETDAVLTHEMIATQTNVGFIKEITEKVKFIKDVISRNNLKTSTIFSDSYVEARKELESISEILTKRLGPNIKILIGDDGCASTSTITPGSFNILTGSNDWHGPVKKFFESRKAAVYKDPKDFIDVTKNMEDYYNILYKNIVALERDLDKFHLTFNSKEGTLHGLPKDFVMIIKIDLCYYLNKNGKDYTPEEFVATILHEYGHNYTSLEKTYYSIKNSVTLMEAMRETLSNDIKDEVTILKVMHKKLGGPTATGSNIHLLATLYDKFTSYYGDDKNGEISRLSSEQQADLFVNRFGLGSALGTALTKHGVWVRYFDTELEDSWELGVWAATITMILTTINATATSFAFSGLLIAVGAGFGWGLIIIGVLTAYLRKANNYFKKESIYELNQFRLLRLKQDNIRQLRLLDKKADKELVKKIMTNIEEIDARIKYILSTSEALKKNSYLRKVLIEGQIDKDTKSLLDMNDLVYDLMENDLHVKYRKI